MTLSLQGADDNKSKNHGRCQIFSRQMASPDYPAELDFLHIPECEQLQIRTVQILLLGHEANQYIGRDLKHNTVDNE